MSLVIDVVRRQLMNKCLPLHVRHATTALIFTAESTDLALTNKIKTCSKEEYLTLIDDKIARLQARIDDLQKLKQHVF